MSMVDSFEKIPVKIFPTLHQGSAFIAQEIAGLIREKQAKKENCVLGLATGSSPKTLYTELVRLHKEEGLSFKNVIAFNLDQYYPLDDNAIQSYKQFMKRNLFDKIDIDPANCHIPSGEWKKENIKQKCREYEQLIENYGGIELQILGIGNNGHIGFNEPGSSLFSKTRLVPLDNSTRIANAYEFPNISKVPRLALTMGIDTILKAKKILLMAWGQMKAPIIQKAVEGNATEQVPASLLQQHHDCLFVTDELASSELTRFKSPWLSGECEWTPKMVRKAVVNTALKLEKPILSLTNGDYHDNGLSDLLVEKGDAYEINLQVFYLVRDSITGWPGGKDQPLPNPPERMVPYPKRCLIFSPHPDDDIISMGGTFMRLHDQGHEVHVAYQTSGNIAVTDEFVTRFVDFAVGFEELSGIDSKKSSQILRNATDFLDNKKNSEADTPEVRSIKGLIRRCEAKATCRYVGLPDSSIHFLNLPFYETGVIEKKPLSEEDVLITIELLRENKATSGICSW